MGANPRELSTACRRRRASQFKSRDGMLDRRGGRNANANIESLMKEWSAENGEKKLLINANLDVDLEDCADLCLFCLVDIPMHKSRLESKHALFSLYAELRASQHLRNMARDRDEADGATSVNIDQFVS
ncbi:hypothetical protein niasHT_016805 [Heterodera trifolii]|uniref:Intraflagellar transport protein 46 homolog n=1 Tax=Heterodera trifolii TaxID=157864 RepID=A0ABD2KZ42_9BILA